MSWVKVCVAVAGVLVAMTMPKEVLAGDPEPSGPPESTFSYSLVELYLRLTTGAPGSSSVFTEPGAAPGTGTMYTLDDIMGVAPVMDQANGATAGDVLNGSTFWGVTGDEWGPGVGTMTNHGAMPTIVPTTTPQSIPAGFHNGSGLVAGDGNLVGTNIVSGVSIFGVPGSASGCYGGTGINGSCNSTCNCQAGLVCVRMAPHEAVNDSVQECILTFYPPPGLPVLRKVCRNWASDTATISADSECISAFQAGLNPYEYFTPLH
jgi:hypothetical protein